MNAVLYARFSSDNQRNESIDAQVRAIKEYAKNHDIAIIRQYIDRAMSGTNDDRPDFKKMIQDSSRGNFEAVIVHKLDRFSRDRLDYLTYKRQLEMNGVKLISV